MLNKKVTADFDQLVKDIETYCSILKKKFSFNNNNDPGKDDIKFTLTNLESLITDLKEKRAQFDNLGKFLSQIQSDYSSSNQTISRKKTNSINKKRNEFKKKEPEFVKEPNEKLINNKNILSGGAWEQNRHRH